MQFDFYFQSQFLGVKNPTGQGKSTGASAAQNQVWFSKLTKKVKDVLKMFEARKIMSNANAFIFWPPSSDMSLVASQGHWQAPERHEDQERAESTIVPTVLEKGRLKTSAARSWLVNFQRTFANNFSLSPSPLFFCDPKSSILLLTVDKGQGDFMRITQAGT